MNQSTHKNLLPDFLIIGAGKSGTTSIDNYLKQHPEIFMSERKEPNFFAYEKLDPQTLIHDKGQLKYYQNSILNLKDYLELFEQAAPGQIKGEVSNTYLYIQDAPHRIKHYIPDVKLIVILRQPVERLYSRYLHLARDNRLPTKKFSDVLDKNTIWWERNDLIKEGMYYKNLSRYFELFPSGNIKVFLFEDFNKYPERTLQSIFKFLGVDDNFKPDYSTRYNRSGFIKNKIYDKLIGHNSIIMRSIKNTLPDTYDNLKSNLVLQKVVNRVRDINLKRPKIDPELKNTILCQIYREDIIKLQKLIQRDLSHWLK